MRAKFVFEVGESNVEPYPISKKQVKENNIVYYFNVLNNNFFINFENYRDNYFECQLDFRITGNGGYSTINTGDLYKIMSTLIMVTKEFITEYKPKIIHIIPKSDYPNDLRRYNVFKQYFIKNFSDTFKLIETIHPGTNEPAMVAINKTL
jgi:hypothetical protein